MITHQNGEDYDIKFNTPVKLFNIISNSYLLSEENSKTYLILSFNSKKGLVDIFRKELKDYIIFNKRLEFAEGTTLYFEYNHSMLKKIKILLINDLIIAELNHIVFANNSQTIIEYYDIFCEGQLAISGNIDIEKVKKYCKLINCSFKKYEIT